MNTWLRRARAVLGMGVIWGAAGALVGGLLELIDNVAPGALPFIKRVDMWPQTLAMPGFIGGVIFATILLVITRRRRFEALSLPRFAAWGGAAGLLLGALGVSNGLPLFVLGLTTLGGAAAASGALAVARRADRRALVANDEERPALSPPGVQSHESK